MILRNEMENIRRSITCPICLCTMKDPITLSGCSHTFCASCIQQSLTTSTNTRRTKSSPYVCPLCHVAFTRRSIQTNSRTNITTLIQHYKRLTQSFGIAPIQYTPSIHTCTQMEEVDSFQNQSSDDSEEEEEESTGSVNSNDSDNDSMEDDEDDSVRLDPSGKRRPSSDSIELSRYPTSLQDIADQYHVSQYMYQALLQQPSLPHRGETTVTPSTTSSLLQQEQAQIVQANQSYYFQKRRNRQKQMKKHPSKPLLKSIPHRNRLDHTPESTSKATMCLPSATTTPTSQSKVSFTTDTVAPSHSTKTNPARESVPTILRSPIPSSLPPRDQSRCTASSTKRKASHKKTAPEEEEVGASTPSWTQIVQAAQSQEVANHNLSDDDDDDDESTHDHFYSALDQIPVSQKSVSQRHDRIVYTTTAATIPEEQNDMWNVDHNNRSAPRCCDQIQDRVEFDMYQNDDDDDSLPDASNIPPPRRNSVVVAEILQQQDSIESVSSETSNNPNDDDDDINLSDTKPPALSIPPFMSNDASKVVPNMNAVTKRRNETAANILLSVPINVTATAAIFRIGDIVQVQPRTGPGMNRLGGIAEIVKVHTSHDEGSDKATTTVSYDVRYVLNRRQREHRLEACYISKAQDYANTSAMVTTTTIQSNTSVTKRYVQRRSCPNPISVLPSPLRAALLADGCDVDGIATRKALAQYNNKSSIGSDKENSVHQNEIPRGEAKTKKAAVQKSNSKRKALVAKTSTTNTVPTKPRQPPTKRIKQSQMRGTVSAGNVDDLPTWTNAVKCQLADERYRSKITAALQKGVIYISTSLLSIVEQEQLQQLCRVVHKNMKGRVDSLK